MNEKPDPRTQLVAETFHDDWATGPAAAFAQRAAAHARRRRTVRRTALATASLAVVMLALFTVTRPRLPAPPASAAPASHTMATAKSAPARKTPAFEIISDEQLMEELRNHSVLILPQPDAAPRIVVLSR